MSRPSHPFRFDQPDSLILLSNLQLSASPATLSLLGRIVLHSTLFWKALSLCSSLNMIYSGIIYEISFRQCCAFKDIRQISVQNTQRLLPSSHFLTNYQLNSRNSCYSSVQFTQKKKYIKINTYRAIILPFFIWG